MKKQCQITDAVPSEKTLSLISCALASSLESTIIGPEWKFLTLGRLLQSITSEANKLSQWTKNVAGLIYGNPEESIVGNAERVAKLYLAELNRYKSKISKILRNTEISAVYLKSLHDKCFAVKKIARWLEMVSLNLALESCHSVELEGVFESLIQENKHLAEKLDRIYEKIGEDSVAASSALFSSNRKISKGLSEFIKIIDSAEKTMEKGTQEIVKLTNFSTKTLDKAAIDTKDISTQIREIVVSLQFHDIASQKVNHIATALRNLGEIAHKETSATQKEKKINVLSRAHTILSIQVAQLAKVIIGVEDHHQKCKKAFEKIFHKVESLATSFQASQINGNKQNKIEGQLTALSSGLESLRVLFNHGCKLNNKSREAAETMCETVSRISNNVYQIRSISSTELHIKALNAILKAERLGPIGRNFEAIAREALKVSKQSRECNVEMVKILEKITLIADKFKSQEDLTGDKQALAGDGELNVSLDTEIKNIAQGYEKFMQASSICLKRDENLQTAISQANKDLSFLSDLSAYLREHLIIMQRLLHSLEPWANSCHDEIDLEIERIAQNYTMEEERDTHNLVSKGAKNF